MDQKIEVEILKDQSEAIPYDTPGIPLYIRTRNLSEYVNMRSFPHRQDEIEIMYLVKGRMQFHVNGKTLLLHAGDCAMVNIRQMHHSSSFHQEDCTFFCVIFHPGLLTGNAVLYEKFVLPVLGNPGFEFYCFRPGERFYGTVSRFLKHIMTCKQKASFAYEMQVIGEIHLFWAEFLGLLPPSGLETAPPANPDLKAQQEMLSFIHQHYGEKLSLDDIAASANVCRSKCHSIFKEYMGAPPIDFLNQYRMEISCALLGNSSLSITEIAVSCGFAHNSYFSQMFRRLYDCTPKEYREKAKKNLTPPPTHR